MNLVKSLRRKVLISILAVFVAVGVAFPVNAAKAQTVDVTNLTRQELLVLIQQIIFAIQQLQIQGGVPVDTGLDFDDEWRADNALRRAGDALDALDELIEEADDQDVSNRKVNDAEDELDDAEDDLRDAEDDFDDGDFGRATDRARDARETADDAFDDLVPDVDADRNLADDAIDRADDAIDELDDLINDADDEDVRSRHIRDAEDELDEAEDLFRDADDEFDDRNYDRALEFARDAFRVAIEAIEDLEDEF